MCVGFCFASDEILRSADVAPVVQDVGAIVDVNAFRVRFAGLLRRTIVR